jgi:hypothetical protein
VEQDFSGAVKGLWDDQVAARVIERRDAERWEQDGRGRLFFDGLQRQASRRGAQDAADIDEGGWAVGTRLRGGEYRRRWGSGVIAGGGDL